MAILDYALQYIVPVDSVSVLNTACLVQSVVYHQSDTTKYGTLLLAFCLKSVQMLLWSQNCSQLVLRHLEVYLLTHKMELTWI